MYKHIHISPKNQYDCVDNSEKEKPILLHFNET